MDTSGGDLSAYLKAMTPPRRMAALQEIFMNSPSPAGKLSFGQIEKDSAFCDRSNVNDCADYLDKELQMLAFPSIYSNKGSLDVIQIMNILHGLLKKHQQASRRREELENRLQRNQSDLEQCQNQKKRLKQNTDSLSSELARSEEVERQLKLQAINVQAKLKAQAEEVKRLKSLCVSNDNQFKHELKKKERLITNLKDKANQLLSDKSKNLGAVFDISRCMQRSDGRRGKWKTDASSNRNEEDMYNVVIGNFEKKCASLSSENVRLREIVMDVHQEITQLNSDTLSVKSDLSPGQLQLPLEMVQQKITQSLRQNCSMLRESLGKHALNSTFTLDKQADDDSTTSDDRIRQLEDRLEECNLIIDRQKKMIEDIRNGDNGLSAVDISLLEEQESLSKEKAAFFKQRAKLEQDKQAIADAALNLNKERKRFEDFKRKALSGAATNGAYLSPERGGHLSTSPRSPSARFISPVKTDRISEHIEHVKTAVNQKDLDSSTGSKSSNH